MKKENKFLLSVFVIILAFLVFWRFSFEAQNSFLALFSFLLLLAGYLLGSLNKGKALPLSCLNKGEKVKILANFHPADFKLGDKRNLSYYILKRGVDNKFYFFKGQENYHHLPYKNFDFFWNGKKLIPQKTKRD